MYTIANLNSNHFIKKKTICSSSLRSGCLSAGVSKRFLYFKTFIFNVPIGVILFFLDSDFNYFMWGTIIFAVLLTIFVIIKGKQCHRRNKRHKFDLTEFDIINK